jgi:hypothetical protein
MTPPNPLVAAPIDTATPFSGAGLLDSGSQLVSAIESGNWLEGTMAGVGVALDTAATVVDPLGSLIGAGLGWLIDHLEPLKGWFNDFTGDAGEVAAFAQTWGNIQAQLQASGEELARIVGDVDELAGEAMDAYRRFQAESAEHLSAAASWAGAMSTGLQIASTIVQVVHDLVRDVLSQLVGSIISWAAEAIFTLGLATPVIVGQVTTRVASLSAKVGKTVIDAITSCKSLAKLLDDLTALLRKAGSLFDSVLKGGGPSGRGPRTPADRTPANALEGATPERLAQDLEALRGYTGPQYVEINEALRGQRSMTPELREQIDAATRALDRMPDHRGIVFRGENAYGDTSYLDAYQPGSTVTNRAFTSADRDAAFPGNVVYQIESLHGKGVRDISVYGNVENEVLFRPGTSFEVLSRTMENGQTEIIMREVE